MVTASCSVKEEQVIIKELKTVNLVFEATNEGEASTKTVVQSDGSSVWWSAHENINIFYGASASSMFTSTNDTPVAKAQFSGSITAFTGETEGNEADYFWGVYPYNALNTCDGSSITATLSGEQTACAGTFADNQWLTLAKSQGLALSFRAVCAGFRFSVTKSGVKSVTFRGNNNEVLAGKARIGMDGNNLPTILENITEVKEITLSAPSNETLEVGTMYYMTFYPTNFTNGFTVSFNTETETATRVYSTAKNFARTQVHIGTNFDNTVGYHSKVQQNNEIWYSTSDGNTVSVPDWVSFGAELVSNNYFGDFGILSFDNDVTIIPGSVFSDSNVTSVTLPETIQKIGSAAFAYSSISSITIPNSVETIEGHAFDNCDNLTSITIPSSVETIESGAFAYCDNLSLFEGKFASPDGKMLITSNNSYERILLAFADHDATSVNISSSGINVDYVDEYAFSGCDNLITLYCKACTGSYLLRYSSFTNVTLSPYSLSCITLLGFEESSVEYLTILEPEDPYSSPGVLYLGWPTKIKSITLPEGISFADDHGPMSSQLPLGCQIFGPNASADHACWIVNGELRLFAFPSNTHFYRLPSSITSIQTNISCYADGGRPYGYDWNVDSYNQFSTGVGVIIPSTVTSIYSPWNFKMPVFLESETPPTITEYSSQNMSGNDTYVVVRNSSIDTYKSAWSAYYSAPDAPRDMFFGKLFLYGVYYMPANTNCYPSGPY